MMFVAIVFTPPALSRPMLAEDVLGVQAVSRPAAIVKREAAPCAYVVGPALGPVVEPPVLAGGIHRAAPLPPSQLAPPQRSLCCLQWAAGAELGRMHHNSPSGYRIFQPELLFSSPVDVEALRGSEAPPSPAPALLVTPWGLRCAQAPTSRPAVVVSSLRPRVEQPGTSKTARSRGGPMPYLRPLPILSSLSLSGPRGPRRGRWPLVTRSDERALSDEPPWHWPGRSPAACRPTASVHRDGGRLGTSGSQQYTGSRNSAPPDGLALSKASFPPSPSTTDQSAASSRSFTAFDPYTALDPSTTLDPDTTFDPYTTSTF